VAPVERPIASSAYSFVRFAGGAVAPYLAGKLAEWVSPQTPFYVGAGAVAVALVILVAGRRYLSDDHAHVTRMRLARDLTLADAA
jgi:MFS family permease